MSRLKEECGVFGIFDNKEIVNSILAESGQDVTTEMDFQKFKET